MTYWVCKQCGRSMKAEAKPNHCYFDRMDAIENISDEDAVKMGLNIPEGKTFEFPGDLRWDPFLGKPMVSNGKTLRQFQNAVMVEVRG